MQEHQQAQYPHSFLTCLSCPHCEDFHSGLLLSSGNMLFLSSAHSQEVTLAVLRSSFYQKIQLWLPPTTVLNYLTMLFIKGCTQFQNLSVKLNRNINILQLMNIESQKRVIEINHALSGVHGEDMKASAIKINEARKEILKRLERKKKLSAIIHDELYGYLQKFPEQKMGLGQQFVKKKKAKMFEYEERCLYKTPSIGTETKRFLTQGPRKQLQAVSEFFRYHLQNMDSESSKDD